MARTTSILTNAEVIAVGYLASLSPNLAVVTDASGYVISSSATATEVGYLSGVTGAIQTQLNGKANLALSNLANVAINTTLLPGANDGAGLGNGSFAFSDLFLASGGVINFNNGNYTLTHSAGVLTTSGKLAIGENDTMTINGSATNTLFAVHVDDGATTENAEFHRHSNNAVGAVIYGAKSRGTGASPAIVNNGDTLLGIYAVGYDGTDYATSGALSFVVDGTPGSNDMPGALHVSLSPDGSQTLTTRLILTNAGAMTLGSVAGAGTGALFAGALWSPSVTSNTSIIEMIDADNNSTSEVWAVRANNVASNIFSIAETGAITATSSITGLTNITASGNATIGTNDTNTHIFRGAFSMAYGSGSTTRLSMTNTGLIMLGASTTPVAGIQLETGNAGTGTPSDYVLIKSSGSVANRGGLLISNQASVSGSTNSFKITGTFNSSTSGVASFGWVDNNATETWVGGASSIVFSYNASAPFTRFNQTVQMLAGQIITSSTANNFINIDNSGNFQLASRSSVNVYIDYDNNTTATALYNIIADNSTTLFSLREDGVFTINYTNAVTNVFTITGTTLTTGSSLRVYDNSSDANVRRVIFATNDHVSATGCIVAHLQQDSTADALYIDKNDGGNAINIESDDNSSDAMYGIVLKITNAGAGLEYAMRFDGSEIVSSAVGGSQDKKVRVSVAGTDYFIPLYTS